jgi:hypothetical protein
MLQEYDNDGGLDLLDDRRNKKGDAAKQNEVEKKRQVAAQLVYTTSTLV